MIYTITFNPSIDYLVTVDDFHQGMVNRTKSESVLCGGKGINVSIVLKNLAVESIALGFIAGFTGQEIARRMEEKNIKNDFITLKEGISRINFKMKSNEESEVNGNGPIISKKDIAKLMDKLNRLVSGDVLVLSGSIPKSVSITIYQEIMKELSSKGILFVVDATGELMLNTLEYKPFLIKPNKHELEEMFHVKLNTKKEIITYAKKLQKKGARNVLISLAGEGAILIAEDEKTYISKAPKGELINSVGAGDSMVAGFLAGYFENKEYLEALKKGIATGSASAFSKEFATKKEVDNIIETLTDIEIVN